jgi:hypothetical protein
MTADTEDQEVLGAELAAGQRQRDETDAEGERAEEWLTRALEHV